MLDARTTGLLRRGLLGWYRRHRRDLPWRGLDDPYAVWVSEIMLQQTRVETVKPYFLRFLRLFPTPAALAAAPLAKVLKAWEGMGYYRRARNLHQAAGRVVGDFGGRLPATAEKLRSLPGIGRYTAGAVASIAFGADEPVLDGNVTRVLCRLMRIRGAPKASATRKRLWSLARRLIPPGRAGEFNQAMMDLGATLCLPAGPQCPACPLRSRCLARARNEQDKLPRKARRKALPHHTVVAGVIWKAGRILIDQRRPDGLLGGLWEFPGGKVRPGESLREALGREVREELAVQVEVGPPLAKVAHAYTHFRITLHAFRCRWVSGRPRPIGCAACRWVRPAQLDQYAFPKANHRIIAALRRPAGEG